MAVCQVAEARARHQQEREAVQRDNAQQRRELAEEERRAAAEKVSGVSAAVAEGPSNHTLTRCAALGSRVKCTAVCTLSKQKASELW